MGEGGEGLAGEGGNGDGGRGDSGGASVLFPSRVVDVTGLAHVALGHVPIMQVLRTAADDPKFGIHLSPNHAAFVKKSRGRHCRMTTAAVSPVWLFVCSWLMLP